MDDAGGNSGAALHEQRDWLHVTLSSIGDAVVTTDIEGRVTFLNPVAETLTGWTKEDAAGLPLETIFKIIKQDTRNTVESPTVRALRDGVIVGLANHTLLISKDCTEPPIDDSSAPIRNAQNEVAGVVLVLRDITERYEQERTIEDALAYAQNIIATLREPFLVLDNNLRVQSANRSFYETFQTSPEQTLDRSVYDLGNGQWNIVGLRSVLDEVLSNHHPVVNFEVVHDFPDIGRKFMLLNACRIGKPGNHSHLILLAIEDITQRKQAEAARQTSEVRYRRLFEAARDGILILNAETMRIVDANPFMQELLGYSHEQFVGKDVWEIGLFQDKSESQTAVRQLRETGFVRYEDLPLESEQGLVRDVEFICNVYREDGQSVAQCNIRDITERKRMERQFQRHAKDLADASRRKDEFLAMLSHELRNPMAPMFNALQLLALEGGENELQREARSIIERQVRHLSRLVDDLLEVSRITTGRVSLHTERVDVNGIVEQAVERIRPNIERRQQELAVSLADTVIWLDADATRLEQVVGNIGLPNMDGYEIARHIRQNPHLANVRLIAVTGYGQDSDRQRSHEAGFDQHLVKPVEATDLKNLLSTIQPSTT